MKSTLKFLILLMVATVLSAAVSCSTTTTPQPGTAGGNNNASTTGGAMCAAGETNCSGICANVASDALNCGACGTICGTGQACQVAVCRCQGALQDCGAGCIAVQSNHDNCGACNTPCDAALVCENGACIASCSVGLTNCNGGCTRTDSDAFNCGACGTVCGAGQTCSVSRCVCADGSLPCNGVCMNLMADPANCGGCGIACAAGQSCLAGVCQGASSTLTTSVTGGTVTGGTVTGGTVTGGTVTGGTVTGGTLTGGTLTGGTVTGGTTGTSTTGGNTGTPAGWWTYDPLGWAGCAWTGVDAVPNSTTTIVPQDFTTKPAGESYCVAGTVYPDYDAVSLLGFNLAEDPTTANCTYDPAKATALGPPGVVIQNADNEGIAINLTKTSANTLRVQIQGPEGATNEAQRWCTTITGVQGKVFVPFSDFYTQCWEGATNPVQYNREPISAVVFLVPGALNATPYDYCIHGFAVGDAAEDAPDGGGGEGVLTGTIGGPGSTDLDYQRVKVAVAGREYIVQNNNWGNEEGTDQTLRYTNNSFVIELATGGEPGGGAPASFPSIFIGANGDTQGGAYWTKGNDNLPKVVSTITSIPTKFSYNRADGDYNASYDVWFSANDPAGAEYDDGISGFVMVWLYKPPNHHPIGWPNAAATNVSLAGQTWNVYVGPRGGATNANAPVVSYIATSTIMSMDFDLMEFIDNAQAHGINQAWYLTDVFGGFEIWNGGGTVGLSVTEFTAQVN